MLRGQRLRGWIQCAFPSVGTRFWLCGVWDSPLGSWGTDEPLIHKDREVTTPELRKTRDVWITELRTEWGIL